MAKRIANAGRSFKPAYASDSPHEYLALLQARAQIGVSGLASVLGFEGVACDALPSMASSVDKDVLRSVAQAISSCRMLDVGYCSMSSGQTDHRKIWPHAFMHTGLRWYVRAYDAQHESFRDFALHRILKVNGTSHAASPVPAAEDDGWTQKEMLEIVPHAQLSAIQKKIVSRDYAMKQDGSSWILRLQLRRCLVPYFARIHELDVAESQPERHHIVLRNRRQLKRLFLNTRDEESDQGGSTVASSKRA